MRKQGRPPQGEIVGKQAAFTTRITPQTKAALERLAKKSGQSVSQLAEVLLRKGLAARQLRDRALGQPHVEALATLIAMTVSRIESESGEGRRWHLDPWAFQEVKVAIDTLLRRREPKGKVSQPIGIKRRADEAVEMHRLGESPNTLLEKEIRATWRKPGNFGFAIAAEMANALETRRHPAMDLPAELDAKYRDADYLLPKLRDMLAGASGSTRRPGEPQ